MVYRSRRRFEEGSDPNSPPTGLRSFHDHALLCTDSTLFIYPDIHDSSAKGDLDMVDALPPFVQPSG